jgi:hypothetical protein
MEIIPSNRGGSKLCYQWYMYTKHATRKTNQWWKCAKRSSTWYRGRLSTTLQNENSVPGQPHNHAPSDTSIKYSKGRNAMKDLANQHPRQFGYQSRSWINITTKTKQNNPKKTPKQIKQKKNRQKQNKNNYEVHCIQVFHNSQ